MSDRPDPTVYDDSAGFRETYLAEIPPEKQPILRGLSDWLLELARESGMLASSDPHNRGEMAAVAADLRHCAGALRVVAFYGTEASVEHSSLRLVILAGELAPRVEELAEAIEAAVAAPAR